MFTSVLLILFRKAFGPWVEPAPPRPKPPKRRLFSDRPRLEVLEDREMLDATTDTLIFNPQGGSISASLGTNYYDATAKQQIQAGQLPNGPTPTNPIQLDGSQASYNVPIEFDKPLTVASLTFQNNYAKTITIDNGDTLTSNGPVTIKTGTNPTLISTDPTGILADANGVAVSVQAGATLNLSDPPQATAPSIFFGKNVAGYLSNAGTVNWKGTASENGPIYDEEGLAVLNTGKFNLDGGSNSAPGVEGGQLYITGQDRFNQSNGDYESFVETAGSLNFANGAVLILLSNYYQSYGAITSDSSEGDTLETADINIAGGTVTVDTVANTVGTLTFNAETVEMNGTLKVSGLTTGGNSTQSDLLDCGEAAVTFGPNSNLIVGTTGSGQLGTGNKWQVMAFGSIAGTQKDWAKNTVPQTMAETTTGTETVVKN